MPDTVLLNELARLREAAPPTRDRLITTLFLVGALHALLILGVTFSSIGATDGHSEQMLEVMIVHDPVVDPRTNETADYLAQVNQRGSGTGADVRHAESPHTPPDDPGAGGEDAASGGSHDATAGTDGEADLLASRASADDKHFFARAGAATQAGSPLVFLPPTQEFAGVDWGDDLKLRGRTERELLVTANTRESSVAVYLDAWQRKVERVASANNPLLEAIRRPDLTGSPVIEVQILANGTLGWAVVTRSSGYPELDRAALAALHLAAPFEPFPRELALKHDSIRLEREWQFVGGVAGRSSVRAPADTR